MKKTIILFVAIILATGSIYSQGLSSSGNLIKGGIEDGQKLIQAYIKPLNKAIVFGLSDVTYSQLRNNDDSRRFEINLKLAYVSLPSEDFTYDVSKLNLQYIKAKDPSKTIAQTVVGDSIKSITLVSKAKDLFNRPLFEFQSPTGGQKSAIPLPYLGVTYRMKHTNLSINLIPFVTVPDTEMKIGMLGVQAQQDLGVFISALKDKNYGVSLQAGGAFLYGHQDLDVSPSGVYVPVSLSGSHTGPYDNQEVDIYYTSLNTNIYGHYRFAEKYTFFAGGGFALGSSRILMLGNYPIYEKDPTGYASVVASDVHDPLDISDTFTRAKFELGARADWKHFFLQLSYNTTIYGGFAFNLGYKL